MRLRYIFHNPVVETLMALTVASHIIAGGTLAVKRVLRERAEKRRRDAVPQTDEYGKKDDGDGQVVWSRVFNSVKFPSMLHRYFGYATSFLIVVHVVATRVSPLLHLKNPSAIDLTMVTQSLNTRHDFFMGVFFHFYYIAFSTFSMYHMIFGMVRSVEILNLKKYISVPRMVPSKWNAIVLATLGLMTVTTLAVGGWFQKVPIPKFDMYLDLEKFIWSLPVKILTLDFSFLWAPKY
ncbi:hypothetical protein HDU67_000113 [Dinochytrium kinnereticum]|nr:hypothetical protein HDU67_000113 [Dinochytrium kinnereticum]